MNREIETQIIAHLLDEHTNYTVHCARLNEQLFTEPDLREVFTRYVKLMKEGRTPDAVNLSADDQGRLKLMQLLSRINYDVTFAGWLESLTAKWRERRLQEIILKATLTTADIMETIAGMQTELSTLVQVNIKEPLVIKHHIVDVFKAIDANQACTGITGIGTGLGDLDTFTGGWQPGDLVVIAGDTSQGKTSLALQFARVAGLAGYGVGVYSYEMSARQLTARVMAQETGVSSKRMLTGKMDVETITIMQRKLTHLSATSIYIDECSSTRLDSLLNAMTTLHLVRDIKLFVIDYLQLLSNPVKGFNKEQEIGTIARELKNFARRTNTTVMLLSQLNRNQNARTDSSPRLSDLRDSGQIEEAADVVILAYRPDVYGVPFFPKTDITSSGKAALIIAKGRNIGLNTIIVNFDKEITLFKD